MKNTTEAVITKNINFGLAVQPYIVIVGLIFEEAFTSSERIQNIVIINNIKYKLETPLKALDTCFKAFFTLNYKYPPESEQVWAFIQKFFFQNY